MRADTGKALLYLVPPEILELALPEEFHGFIRWFHGLGNANELESCASQALGDARGVLGLASVYTAGAQKYAPWNWAKGLTFSNLYNSAIRHALKMQVEELDAVADGGTGLPHAWHYSWNVGSCFVFTQQGRTDLDDRAAVIA